MRIPAQKPARPGADFPETSNPWPQHVAGLRQPLVTLLPPLESVALLHADPSATQPATLHPLPGDNSAVVPPDPIPNSEVKPLSADDSVAGCHVKVGHRQALKYKARLRRAFFWPTVFKADITQRLFV